MRDWTKTLYPSSYKGVPFWIKHDDMLTGRRLNVTEIPRSDIPFIEDLGAKQQPIDIAGYFIGDVSDVQLTALEKVCAQDGAGPLVMPAQGPLTARCHQIKRNRDRDQMGRFGFDASFVLDPRSGFATPQSALPADYLAQRAFDAADGLLPALGGLLKSFHV